MICFYDRKVHFISQAELNRSKLFLFLIQEENMEDVIVVYDENSEFLGIVTYKTLLHSKNKNSVELQKEYIIASENIFQDANKIFDNKDLEILPVFNNNGDLLTFCYSSEKGIEYYFLESVIHALEEKKDNLFINDLYPNVSCVYIYDLNEWAYRLYKILINRNFPVVVIGSRWKQIFNIETKDEGYPTFSRLNIYSEGNSAYVNEKKSYHEFFFIDIFRKLGFLNRLYECLLFKEEMKNKGLDNVLVCSCPEIYDLTFESKGEAFRNKYMIFGAWIEKYKDSSIKKDEFKKVSGLSVEEFIEKKKKEKEIYNNKITIELQDNKNVSCFKYGNGNRIIYLIVPECVATITETTFEESLQYTLIKEIEKDFGELYSIISIPVFEMDFWKYREIVNSLNIREEDIVININRFSKEILNKLKISYKIDYDIADMLKNRNPDLDYFFDQPIHLNKRGVKILSEELYNKFLKKFISKTKYIEDEKIDLLSNSEKKKLNKYLNSISKYKSNLENVGAIVMNCNPFTKGHLYLIEEAMKQVDYLYIFVVEEDKSFFKFNERFELVKRGVAHLENVSVIPSGKFILSYTTLPSYFEKEKEQDVVIDATNDINIFSRYIAPYMNIKIRFAGEEPIDNITRQYNEEMRKTLIANGIDFIEIPRLHYNNRIISASYVRKLIKESNIDEIKNIVPESTFEFLCEKYL
ncbi:adenylyltransferase/cytidyltransferase family protein [Clostridium sp. MSJ-8]|uniref:adenylyltransferase/cytidyltransferase family protein n=1 Tax=Clostridium sp. MSJ-8 TaxID=2841510 RepID=UPI001C0E964B|nr:adenylyltransferase/cytidyltransferase family protein [Clostridium sp. MSJ-8]MBU5488410.1 adenylyltransferase/cytidyltransferase family protein [Clostridium sp. MSJ-8]